MLSSSSGQTPSGKRDFYYELHYRAGKLVYGSVVEPGLGIRLCDRTARISGPGTSPVSWVSFRDVAEICTLAIRHPMAERRTIQVGGPKAMSMLEVVKRFEKIGGQAFQLEHIPEQTLRRQFERAADSMQMSFAALMLGCAYGDEMNMEAIVRQFGIKLTSVDDYARSVLREVVTGSIPIPDHGVQFRERST